MKLEIAYGGAKIELEIPSSVDVDVYSPVTADEPTGFDSFETEFLAAGGVELLSDTLLIIVNDAYRNTPTATVLEWLHRIDHRFLNRSCFLVATGSHLPPTRRQLQRVFGRLYNSVESQIITHDARDRSTMTRVGVDSLGGDVWLHEAILRHSKVLAVGSVEPHYFAGFTGGRKSIFPGLTDEETIERNHNLANSLDAAPMKLTGNPVAEHLDSLMRLVDDRQFFGIQIVLDAEDRIAGLCCGRLDRAFHNATQLAERIFSHRAKKQYDAIVCEVLPPLDSNLYQVQKALENCQAAVRDGGKVFLVSACEEGIGSQHFFELARQWDPRRNAPVDGRLRFGSHKLSRVIVIRNRIDVFLHSNLPDEVVRQVYYEPLDIVKEFLFLALEENRGNTIAVVRDAGNTVLKI